VKISIAGRKYSYITNPILEDGARKGYFDLVRKVFGLDFNPWYQSGFYTGNFIPYSLFDGEIAVSSVGIVINDFMWDNSPKRYVQISTVVTDPAYRGRGLSRWLMQNVMQEWADKCDCMYLYANDSVIDFYPKFGFIKANEHRYHMPLTPTSGEFRKLDLSMRRDVDLLLEKYGESNPFSRLCLIGDTGLMMFHCVTFLHEKIYYIGKYDAVVIAECENDNLFCYDIFAKTDCNISDLLGIIALDTTKTVTLGFTPKVIDGYTITKANEKNTTFFVLGDKENILEDNQVTFPFLSRA
jgi:GNAT superfamily N-acetyltransferase